MAGYSMQKVGHTGVLDGRGDKLGAQDLGNLPLGALLANEALGDHLEESMSQRTADQETYKEDNKNAFV